MMSRISQLQSLLKNQSGMVAIMFGLSLLVILAVVGVAIDYSTITRDRVSFQDTMDSAVLAGARTTYSDEEKVQKAEAHFRAALKRQYGDVFESSKKNALNFEVLEGGTVVKGDFTIEMPTMMLGFIGQSTVTQSVTAKAKVGEVAGQVEQIDFAFCVDSSLDSVRLDITRRDYSPFINSIMSRLNEKLLADNLTPINNMRARFLMFQDFNAYNTMFQAPSTGVCISSGNMGSNTCDVGGGSIGGAGGGWIPLPGSPLVETRKNASQQFINLRTIPTDTPPNDRNIILGPQVEDYEVNTGVKIYVAPRPTAVRPAWMDIDINFDPMGLNGIYSYFQNNNPNAPPPNAIELSRSVFLPFGGDPDESGLICLNEAIRSDWAKAGDQNANGDGVLSADAMPVVVMITPSDTKPVGQEISSNFLTQTYTYPGSPPTTVTHLYSALQNRPSSVSGILSNWNNQTTINQDYKTMILFSNVDNTSAQSFNDSGQFYFLALGSAQLAIYNTNCPPTRCPREVQTGRTASWDVVADSFENLYKHPFNLAVMPTGTYRYGSNLYQRDIDITGTLDSIYLNIKDRLTGLNGNMSGSNAPQLIK